MRVLHVITLVVALALPHAASAAVIYNEAVDGDAGTGFGVSSTPPVLNLALGQNDIVGSATFGLGVSDFDSFDLVVAPNTRIAAVKFTTALQPVGSGVFNTIGWALGSPADFPFVPLFQLTPIPSTSLSGFVGGLPLGPGTYRFGSTLVSGLVS